MKREQGYYAEAYGGVEYNNPATLDFLGSVFDIMKRVIPLNDTTSLLDIGCGRGYFLKYLDQLGFGSVRGIEPCSELIYNGLHGNISQGSFEHNDFPDKSFDIVFTCHTLHHLPQSRPVQAIAEMLRIAREYVVIVEINNTNIPMLIRSLLRSESEMNAYRYNIYRVNSMMAEAGCNAVISTYLPPLYLSGDSLVHRVMARIGAPPYNINIAKSST